MRTLHVNSLLRAGCLTLLLIAVWSSSRAQTAPALTPQAVALIAGAADRGDANAIVNIVAGAIAGNPSAAGAIVRQAVGIAPQYRDRIVAGASAAFPGFATTIADAATTAAPAAPAVAATPDEPWPVSGEIALGGSKNTGNTENEEFNVTAKALYESGKLETEGNLDFDVRREDENTTKQRLVVDLQPRYDLNERWYAFGFLEYRDDRFSGFEYEFTESAGLGYRVFDSERLRWSLEAGPGARQSKVEDTGDVDDQLLFRAASRLAWQISETAELSNDTEFVVDNERRRTENETALSTRIIGDLSGRISFEIRHNSNPPDDNETTDTRTKISLVYGF